MGRVLHITSTYPPRHWHHRVYAPAGNSLQNKRSASRVRPLAHAELTRPKPPQREDGSICSPATGTPCWPQPTAPAGDGSARRCSHGVRSEGRRPQSRRAQSCTPPHFRPVFEDGERHTSSRIDDIMLCGVQRSQRASARTTLPRSGPRAADCASTQWEQACLSPATRQSPTREAHKSTSPAY
jgi:hypothetical protein